MEKLKSAIRNPQSAILLIGYGNPGRLDDGLGPALAEAVAKMGINGVTVDSDYQLVVDDAVDVSNHDIVIFADADVNGPEPFYFKKIEAASSVSFSSHSITPRSLLALVKEIYDIEIDAYILGIRGYEFNDFEERLSECAKNNLSAALEFIETTLKTNNFQEVRAEFAD